MTDFTSERPAPDEYAPYFGGYVSLVGEGDLLEILRRQVGKTAGLLRSVPEGRAGEGYEPGKWSVKELVGHMLDTERVFAYRALCVARGEKQSLPSMDQDTYVRHANFNSRRLSDLVDEFERVRATTLDLLTGLDREAWGRRGVANENEVTVRALAHIIAGHEAHHLRVLRERYLRRAAGE